MNEQAQRFQNDARLAFEWLGRMYDRSKVALDDAEAFFEEAGWSTQFGSGMGGVCTTTVLDEWPFVYLKVFAGLPPGITDGTPNGRASLFGILFHDAVRQGPTCIAARVDWSSSDAICDHWMTYAALGGDGPNRGAFDRTDGPTRTATPNKNGRASWPGVERLVWFEVPVAVVSSPDILRRVVDANRSLVDGDEAPALALLKALEL